MLPRKIKAVDKGKPRSDWRFTVSIRPNGERSVMYRTRELGFRRVFHYVYDRISRLSHWEEKTPYRKGMTDYAKVMYERLPHLKPKQ